VKKPSHFARPLVLVASIALFIYMFHLTTAAAILEKARLLGWGFVSLLLLSGVRQGLRTVAWRSCVEPGGHRLSLLDLFGLRLVGEALNDMTPAGPLLGETAKVLAVSRRMSTQSGASSVVIENLIYGLAAVLFMLSGVVLALLKLATSHGFRWLAGGLVICSLLTMLFCFSLVSRRVLLLGMIIDRLKGWGLDWAFLDHHERDARVVEMSIYDFFLTRRSLFLYILAIEIATNFTGIAEAYLVLKATTAHSSVLAAYLAESASRAVQWAFAFVPFGLGVQEGVAAATLEAFGYTASEGVSLAVIRKIRTLVWAALGLLLAAKYSIAKPAEGSAT
jgi:uncharacterized membrane protein YbhN (UPF0104 family)